MQDECWISKFTCFQVLCNLCFCYTAKYIPVNSEHNNVCSFTTVNLFIHVFIYVYITIMFLCEFITGGTTNVNYFVLFVSCNQKFGIKASNK